MATKHGIDAVRAHPLWVALDRLPTGTKGIRARVEAFHRFLHLAVADLDGDGDGKRIMQGAYIDAACKWELVAELTGHWLRTRVGQMSDADRLSYARQYGNAVNQRNVALKALGLDRPVGDTIAQLYGLGVTE